MKTIKIGYTMFAVPANWTTKQVGQFAAQMAELTQVNHLGDKIGENWENVYYLSAGDGVTIGQHVGLVLPNYDAARQHLNRLMAAVPVEQETETA